MTQPLTDAINALTRYANETTGADDQTLSEAVGTLVAGYGKGGGDMWQTLYDETTEADGLLQVAVTDISVHEIKVVMIQPKSYSSSAVVYACPNNPNGTHWEKGYGRMYVTLANSTASNERVYTLQNDLCLVDGLFTWTYRRGNINNEFEVRQISQFVSAVAGQEITSVSVATYVSIPAGMRVVVLGK